MLLIELNKELHDHATITSSFGRYYQQKSWSGPTINPYTADNT